MGQLFPMRCDKFAGAYGKGVLTFQMRHREEMAPFPPLKKVFEWSTWDCCRYSGTIKGATLKMDKVNALRMTNLFWNQGLVL